ncbi:MAG TPA: hypothetical protein PK819_04395, partial [Thermomicrobiales bacterium]|nr:hypothetical protein [Thermomicrobiales bacterium]
GVTVTPAPSETNTPEPTRPSTLEPSVVVPTTSPVTDLPNTGSGQVPPSQPNNTLPFMLLLVIATFGAALALRRPKGQNDHR